MAFTNHKAVKGGNMAVHTVTAAEATANAATIDFKSYFTTAITGFVVQVYRAGVNVTADAVISASGTVLTVADGAVTYNVTAGDIVHAIVF